MTVKLASQLTLSSQPTSLENTLHLRQISLMLHGLTKNREVVDLMSSVTFSNVNMDSHQSNMYYY